MRKVSGIIRYILTVGLMYFIFRESGWITAIAFALVFTALEMQTSLNGKQAVLNDLLMHRLKVTDRRLERHLEDSY